MKRIFIVPAIVTTLFAAQGCEDVGQCKDPNIEGRVPVLDGQGRVMYAGQAILLSSCSSGCHSSRAQGADRKGAPAGLDFDIEPLEATVVDTVTNDKGESVSVASTSDRAGLAGLRKRQRKVFDTRDLIWRQLKDGLMPPSGVGEGFRDVSKTTSFYYPGAGPDKTATGCTRVSAGFDEVNRDPARETLREWLACGAPIVEITAPPCAGAPDGKCLPKPVAGTVGDQFPECALAMQEATFENVYSTVFEGAGCTSSACHGAPAKTSNFDLSSIDAAYTQLVGADGKGQPQPCPVNMDPYVTPGDPDKSYLVAKCTMGATNICGGTMPLGGALSPALLKVLSDWIAAGAPGPGEGGGSTDADAGM
jgi:hypothetical protein